MFEDHGGISATYMKLHEAAVPIFSCILVVCEKCLKEFGNNKHSLSVVWTQR